MDRLGHFYGEFRINGRRTRALVDTGAKLVTGENIDEAKIQDLLTPPLKKYLGE